MLLMQPLELHRWLLHAGLDDPDGPGWRMWRSLAPEARSARGYLLRMWLLLPCLALLAALFTVGLLLLLRLLDPSGPAWKAALFGALGAATAGACLVLWVGVAFGVAVAAALGVTLTGAAGLTFGMLAGTSPGQSLGIVLGLTGGAAVGLALDATRGVAHGQVRGMSAIVLSSLLGGAAYGAMYRLVARAVDPSHGDAAGIGAAAAYAGALFLTSLRLPLYPVEALAQILLYRLQYATGARTLRFAPILFHDLNRVPLPGLFQHVLLGITIDSEVAERVRQRCELNPGQRRLGTSLLPYFQAREMAALAARREFGALVRLQGEWLPGVAGASPWMLRLREAARYLEAATATLIPYHQTQHLERAAGILSGLEYQLLADGSRFAMALRQTLATWRSSEAELRRENEAAAVRQIPNPFRTEPLTPDQGHLFRGRDALVRQIDGLLGDPAQSLSLALIGPRRCGKTSLLQMLPNLLPDTVCIFYDITDNPLDSPASFFNSLAGRACEQAARDHRLVLPPLPPGPPFEAGRAWLEALDRLGEQYRILLCFDEFERLEELWPGEPRELLQLMGLLRGTIQHRRRLRLLVSGAAPFDELGRLWNDHFINLRELRIGHLDRPTALDLLCRPMPEFPQEALPTEVAEAVFAQTKGQPYLLQMYGSFLVFLLNDEGRSQACLNDVERVGDRILTEAAYYFHNTVLSAPPEARLALGDLAAGRAPDLTQRTRVWLRRRGLLAEDGRIGIPILGAWMREEVDF
jgi:hypothetical protein